MKPFPWKCATCGERAVERRVLDYTAEFEHDGRPYQFVVPGLEVLQCGRCKAIVLDDEANRRVTEAFRAHAGLLTPEQIRAHRKGLHLSQEQLAACLKVANSTVSRWETGAQIQQRAMDTLLRTFFQVPEARRFLGLQQGDGPNNLSVGSQAQEVQSLAERFPGLKITPSAGARTDAQPPGPRVSSDRQRDPHE